MPSPFAKVIWSKFETVLLMDTYEKVASGEIVRKDAISKLSKRLRYRMIKNGIEVNEKYRDEISIQLQLSAIEYMLTDEVKGLPEHSKLFEEVAKLSLDSREEYIKLLNEANRMYPLPLEQENSSTESPSDTYVLLKESTPKEKLLEDRVTKILMDNFPKGMRLNSAIDKKRFLNYYNEIDDSDIAVEENELLRIVKSCGIETDSKVYVPDCLLPFKLQKEISSFVDESFELGRVFIYYDSLFLQFKDSLLNTPVANSLLLKTWLCYHYGSSLYFAKDYMSRNSDVKIDIDKEVISYMREQWQVKSEEEVVNDLRYLPESSVRTAFNRNQDVLIAAARGSRFHIDKFEVTDDELDEIADMIETVINQFEFVGADELFKMIRQKLPQVVSRNAEISELGIRKVLAVRLGGKFDFSNAVISRKGIKLSAKDALLAFARSREEFTMKEVVDFAHSLGTEINFHLLDLLDCCLRINENEFVAKDKVHFDVESVDDYIAQYIDKTLVSVPLRSITNFATFPESNFPWTPRLLESYLLTASKHFTLYLSRYLNRNKICGVISYKSSNFTFDFIMSLALARSKVNLEQEEALDFLVTEGYIAQRRCSDIETLLVKAEEIRKLDKNENK